MVFDSTATIMDNVSQKDVVHFCYSMTKTEEDSPQPDFQQSRMKEFNSLTERSVLCIVLRKDEKGYCIHGARVFDEIKKGRDSRGFEKSIFVVPEFSYNGEN